MTQETSPGKATGSVAPAVIRESDDWLVVNKPARWHTLARANQVDQPDVLQQWLAVQRPELVTVGRECGIVHRLDYLTSGAVLVAKTTQALARLTAAMRAVQTDSIHKQYLAIVSGPIDQAGSFELFFTARYRRSKKITVSTTGDPSHCGRCRWAVLKPVIHGALLRVDLLGPGRRHEVRAGLAFLGHPLRGDTLYGASPWDAGLALHAWRLTIDRTQVTCNPPDEWRIDLPADSQGAHP